MVLLVDVMSSVLALDKHYLHKCHLYNEDIEHPHSLGIYDLFLDDSALFTMGLFDSSCIVDNCNVALLSGLFLDVLRLLWNK